MKRTRPERGLERLLAALEQDLLLATDEEILEVANEMGLKPDMKGSIALAGVTFTARVNFPGKRRKVAAATSMSGPVQRAGATKNKDKSASKRDGGPRTRRRAKGDAPSN